MIGILFLIWHSFTEITSNWQKKSMHQNYSCTFRRWIEIHMGKALGKSKNTLEVTAVSQRPTLSSPRSRPLSTAATTSGCPQRGPHPDCRPDAVPPPRKTLISWNVFGYHPIFYPSNLKSLPPTSLEEAIPPRALGGRSPHRPGKIRLPCENERTSRFNPKI